MYSESEQIWQEIWLSIDLRRGSFGGRRVSAGMNAFHWLWVVSGAPSFQKAAVLLLFFLSRLVVRRLRNRVYSLSKRFREPHSKIRTPAAVEARPVKSRSQDFERNPERRHVSPKNRGSIQARSRGPEAMKSSLGQMKETGERIDTVIEDSMGRDANGPPRPRETGGE